MYKPLLPRREKVPSVLATQSNFSQSPIVARLQVIACTPFSEETYLPMLCRATLPPPASTTVNCSHACAVGRLQVIACTPFSPLTNWLLLPRMVIVAPIGALPGVFTILYTLT